MLMIIPKKVRTKPRKLEITPKKLRKTLKMLKTIEKGETCAVKNPPKAQQNTGNTDEKAGDDTSKENTPVDIAPQTKVNTETGNTGQSEEVNEFDARRRNAGRELSAIFCFHAASVLLGAVAFTVMQLTSSDFQVSCAKVKEASRIDLTNAISTSEGLSLSWQALCFAFTLIICKHKVIAISK